MQPTSSNDPAVATDRIEGMYEDLATMQVELDADPLELGPKRRNGKIAACRGMLSRCETIFLSISQDLYRYRRSLRTAEADFKLQMRELMTNDPEVRMGRNVTDREAIASTRLRTQAEEIDRLTACVEDLGSVLVVVRTKRADLKDIQNRLKDQLKVCQEELGLGGKWGHLLKPRAGVPPTDVPEVRELPLDEPEVPSVMHPDESEVPVVPDVPSSNAFTDTSIDDLLDSF